jgi:hypothetical protein
MHRLVIELGHHSVCIRSRFGYKSTDAKSVFRVVKYRTTSAELDVPDEQLESFCWGDEQ